jgi:hypothetical protein
MINGVWFSCMVYSSHNFVITATLNHSKHRGHHHLYLTIPVVHFDILIFHGILYGTKLLLNENFIADANYRINWPKSILNRVETIQKLPPSCICCDCDANVQWNQCFGWNILLKRKIPISAAVLVLWLESDRGHILISKK